MRAPQQPEHHTSAGGPARPLPEGYFSLGEALGQKSGKSKVAFK